MTKTDLALVGGTDIEELNNLTEDQQRRMSDPTTLKAMRRFLARLLDESVAVPNLDFIPCPLDMKIYNQSSKADPFTPENLLPYYVEDQKVKSFSGVEILVKVKSGNVRVLGAEHAFFLLDNPWRVRMQLNRYAIAFFGTIFCSSTRINDKIQAYEQFVVVLENDEDEELKARLKPLNETFDRFYPLAVLT